MLQAWVLAWTTSCPEWIGAVEGTGHEVGMPRGPGPYRSHLDPRRSSIETVMISRKYDHGTGPGQMHTCKSRNWGLT